MIIKHGADQENRIWQYFVWRSETTGRKGEEVDEDGKTTHGLNSRYGKAMKGERLFLKI